MRFNNLPESLAEWLTLQREAHDKLTPSEWRALYFCEFPSEPERAPERDRRAYIEGPLGRRRRR